MYPHLRTAAVAGAAMLSLALAPGQPYASESLSEPQLRAALLDAVDFPQGWARDSERSAARRGFGVPRPAEPACQDLFAGDDTAARAGFARTRSGPFVTTAATDHGDADSARRALAAFDAAVTGECGTFHAREAAGRQAVTAAYDAAAIDRGRDAGGRRTGDAGPRLGEDSLTVRFQRRPEGGRAGGTPVIAEVVMVRVGAQTLRVAQAGRDGGDGTRDGTGGLDRIAARAVEKLEQVAAGRTPAPRPDQPGTTEL